MMKLNGAAHGKLLSRLVLAVAVALLCLGSALIASTALAQGESGAEETEPPALSRSLIEEAEESPSVETQGPEVDTQAAHELPHSDLDGEEALELATAVFGAAIEEPAGIYDEMPPARFIGTNAAVMSSESLAVLDEESGSGSDAPAPTGPALVESIIPLRTEDEAGNLAPVDLGLEHAEGELQEENPIVPTGIPAELGEGVELGEGGIGISFPGAAPGSAAATVEDNAAFYANVREDTDLIVAPMPTGVETLTQIRTAAAPGTQVDKLSLPPGAILKTTAQGGAEVILEGEQLMEVTPAEAVDAAGTSVPTTLSVSGDELTITVSPGQGTVYPILVDPNFRLDEYNWTWGGSGFNGWTGGTSAPGYMALPNAGAYPALDLTAGFPGGANAGTGATWTYTVPRYYADLSEYGDYPHSFIELVHLNGMMYLDDQGNTVFPAINAGILTPGGTAWISNWGWTGNEGEFGNWVGSVWFSGNANPQAKEFIFSLYTGEHENQARLREALAAEATIELRDEDTPELLEVHPPASGWFHATEPVVTWAARDVGLGVTSLQSEAEGRPTTLRTFQLGCSGTTARPCPRVARSSEAGRPAVKLDVAGAPTGEDYFQVSVQDPLYGFESGGKDPTPHTSSVRVGPVKVDNTAPEVTLSGALTEQEKLGTLKSEYPLAIKAIDGTEADPQSGVTKVEVKVDGKAKSSWKPGCATESCPFSGSWILKTSEYTAASHEVEVLVTDAAGNVSENTIEVDLGEAPPQTSFTSPHPSHETTELTKISFKATRGGAPVEGATYRCSLDGAAATACTSPYTLPEHFTDGPHAFTVAAVDKGGKADPTPATWRFETNPYPAAPTNEKLDFPETGEQTASYYTLEAEWGAAPEGKAAEGVTGVTFQMQLPGYKKNEKGESILENGKLVLNTFETVPAECTIDGQGRPVSWPLPVHVHPGHNAPVYLRVRGCKPFELGEYPEKGIEFRAVFDGGAKVAGASAPATTEFVSRANANRVATDATETVGPATVDLLTGAFTMSHTDVSIPVPGYEANLEFTRTYSSTISSSLPGYSYVLGGAWQPGVPLESESEGQAWSQIVKQVVQEHGPVYGDECWTENEEGEEEGTYPCPAPRCNGIETCEEWLEEDAQPHEEWIELLDDEGAAVTFEIVGENTFVAPEYAKELKLTYQGGNLVLAYPNGSRNIFVPGAANEWRPEYVTFQATPSSMRMVYKQGFLRGEMKLVREIAPTPEAIKCEEFKSEAEVGCRTLEFEYHEFSIPEHYGESREKLVGISYYGPSGNDVPVKVAQYEYELKTVNEIPVYGGVWHTKEEMLVSERDPRLPIPAETYSYEEKSGYGYLMHTATPPGQEPWGFEYEYGTTYEYGFRVAASRVKTVTRAGQKTTLAYGVPVSGAGAPYPMGAESIAKWGQSDLPVDATAIFPPNHVPTKSPPTEYTGATIHYMDPEGYEVNTASPSPPGVAGASISTTETDVHGDVVRELGPRARLAALESSNPAARSHELDSHTVYNAAGTEALESWGPLHPVRLESGESVEARQHTITRYDEEEPTPPVGTPPAYLPTKETVAAVVSGKSGEFEPKVTVTHYEWAHRLPEETIVDPGGLDIRSVTKYNGSGQVIETRQPKGASGGTAGDTRTIYYSAEGGECVRSPRYAGLPCKVLPAKQESGGAARPELLVKKFTAYNDLGEPEVITESPGGGSANVRTTVTEYDSAGRPRKTEVTGGGVALARTKAKIETVYSPTLGSPEEQKFICGGTEAECKGFDSQATKTTFNTLGQATAYFDADGAKTEMTYDALGRPATVTDPRGTETMHYDEASGALTSLEVSGVGTFTAAYDADGDLIHRGLPNGLTANTTYNIADEPTKLTYTKESSCGSKGCTWFEETLERSAEGRILAGEGKVLAEPGSQVSNLYKYDAAGRLTEAQETPASSGLCTSRLYTFDADSNRLTKTTRPSAIKGAACPSSGGTTQKYEYDNADRLIGPTYDAFGRIESLPAEFAGGKALTTEYFANNMVAKQTQNGVSNTFQLDSTGRQRQREQEGGVAGVEIFHYDGPGDSPAWTALGSMWSRDVTGIGGELAAVQESSGTTTFKLTDLHGDVVASASSSPSATELLASYRFSEFGEPMSGGSGRFGWLGGMSRRTELQSGVIQMGARSYIPQLGRFLTPDSIPGGSANAYDYADQDPVNSFDLGGTKKKKMHTSGACPSCKKAAHEQLVRLKHTNFKRGVREIVRGANNHVAHVIAIAMKNHESESQEESTIGGFLNALGNAPSVTYHGVASALKTIGATISPVLPSCAEIGAASDVVSFTSGSIAIGLAAFPPAEPAAGTLGLISGGAGLNGALFDVLGKEEDC
jgi:RHS repeat-associated protein